MFGRMGPWEIALIVVIILIVFGVGKLPQVGSAVGKGMRAFRRGERGEADEEEEEVEEVKPVRKAARKVTKSKAKT